jgi:hypothetical protein
LEFKLLFASLDRANYQAVTDPATGAETQRFVCPDELSFEVQSWQTNRAPTLAYLLLPDRCEQRLQSGQSLSACSPRITAMATRRSAFGGCGSRDCDAFHSVDRMQRRMSLISSVSSRAENLPVAGTARIRATHWWSWWRRH